MARHVICAIYDRALQAYLRPFVAPALGVAIRAFGEDCKVADSPLKKHPTDYTLYLLAEFDDQTGAIVPRPPEPIEEATNYSEV